ncbi:Gfo/Idh/MocA family protein [Actinopolymorpha rutila]|uniref:Putative dehydrogenase n=1 Tax=Actinopolymorpha rutila TaxID=446787 RepID=A0A852ZNC3_9ACTN|nr:Gfo/Idh/MocA family oxidoreductase [Actinopolymorpha rutila]NYH90969.1 putative dehydrogenase [Actinopolymorpha rutila]
MTSNTASGETSGAVNRPLRALQVGAGGMGRGWLRTLLAYEEVELVGVADLDVARAKEALEQAGAGDVATGPTVEALADQVRPDFVVDVTIPEAHHPVTMEALRRGLPVLGEKPLAASLAESLELTAAAQAYDRLFMVSQSRRYDANLFAFRRQLRQLGRLGILTAEFFKAPHFGGFRDAMDHPLVLDMAIHAFDSARFLLEADPVAVYCEEYNPGWSWYAGDAAATAIFEFDGGLRYVYTGSWCSPGQETSWNAAWRASGEHGTALWDGDGLPTLEIVEGGETAPEGDTSEADPHPGIAGSLREFVAALRTGTTPMGTARDNVASLAMVYAAIESARDRRRVLVADVLEEAYAQAKARAEGPVLEALTGWTSLTPPG